MPRVCCCQRRAVERSHASESTLSSTQRLLPCSEAQGYSAIAAADDTSVSGLHARRLITGIQEANEQAVAHQLSSSRNGGGVDTTPRLRLHVEFRKLDYHLPSGRQILHGLSGQLRPGRLTGTPVTWAWQRWMQRVSRCACLSRACAWVNGLGGLDGLGLLVGQPSWAHQVRERQHCCTASWARRRQLVAGSA